MSHFMSAVAIKQVMRLLSTEECTTHSEALIVEQRKSPRIHAYAGNDSSHSWIWLVSALEKMGFLKAKFVDSHSLLREARLDSQAGLILSKIANLSYARSVAYGRIS